MKKQTKFRPCFRLRELMSSLLQKMGLNQTQFGKLTGYDPNMVSHIVNGHCKLSVRRALSWEPILGVSAETLLYAQVADLVAEERARTESKPEGGLSPLRELMEAAS